MKSVDLQILALEHEASYVAEDERLNQMLSNNLAGIKTAHWTANNIIYQTHGDGESWFW